MPAGGLRRWMAVNQAAPARVLPASCVAAAMLAAVAVPFPLTWSGGMAGPSFAISGAAAAAGLLRAAAIMARAAWCLAGAGADRRARRDSRR